MVVKGWVGYFIVAFSFVPLVAVAAPINPVDPGTLTVGGITTFETLSGGAQPGTNYDGIVAVDGSRFAERFSGQALSANGNFDALSGIPTNPLALQVGDAGENLVILDNLGSNVLAGLGPLGFPENDAGGEGAIAILFTLDQFEVGFRIIGGNGGIATVNFFARDGTMIDSIDLSGLGSDTAFAFRREGNLLDIAGLSIHTTDSAGIGIDDIRFTPPVATPVPVPATLLLMAIGLAGVGALARRAIR